MQNFIKNGLEQNRILKHYKHNNNRKDKKTYVTFYEKLRSFFAVRSVVMDFRWDIIVEYAPFLWKGTLLTIGLSIASILLGVVLGLVYWIREND